MQRPGWPTVLDGLGTWSERMLRLHAKVEGPNNSPDRKSTRVVSFSSPTVTTLLAK